MRSPDRSMRGFYNGSISRPDCVGGAVKGGLFVFTTGVALLCGAGAAHSGPCTAQIAQLEQQIEPHVPDRRPARPRRKRVGAQLHHQPTPGAVEHAERVGQQGCRRRARSRAQGRRRRQRRGCNAALSEARRLYGIDRLHKRHRRYARSSAIRDCDAGLNTPLRCKSDRPSRPTDRGISPAAPAPAWCRARGDRPALRGSASRPGRRHRDACAAPGRRGRA